MEKELKFYKYHTLWKSSNQFFIFSLARIFGNLDFNWMKVKSNLVLDSESF